MLMRKYSSSAPKWRYYDQGLNVEAYGHSMVIKPLGFRVFKFDIDSELCKCPLCGYNFNELTCGFWDAIFRYSGYISGNPISLITIMVQLENK
ncbi:9990_t:CDS:2 [Funneliformis caledonium]|uniref:9990_t:CDS:1 n=1 Tax=Funneliformis caledonium TaxID=1117310 RepID=A0A9N9BZ53_9GLOM|nr:9990_t:CDS:2 [Funneliformis caledonium]